jgi:cephalosporin-C deacetylase-like acetyl esterase
LARTLPDQCEIILPALINRDTTYSTALGRQTGVSHREWIYRQAFVQGRHVLGMEVQKVLALADAHAESGDKAPLFLVGEGEGGLIALIAAALDERFKAVFVSGVFGPMEGLWAEPIYRNIQGFVRDFGAAELAAMMAPRQLVISSEAWPSVSTPEGKSIAAPGEIKRPSDETINKEVQLARQLGAAITEGALEMILPTGLSKTQPIKVEEDNERQKRLVNEASAWCQRQLFTGEMERGKTFWDSRPKTLPEYEKWAEPQRERFWKEVIGDLPWPNVPANPRSRLVNETESVRIYEVVLDVWEGVFAWGWLALPKDIHEGENRPVVVCQHGLEGVPADCLTTDTNSRAYHAYKAFALRLAERGYVTFSPHNLYRGGHAFRGLQRKLNLLGKSLFSVIIPQHRCILDWLKTQPWADADRLAFYGLSYGGKSAMRIPAVLTDYCLSICSGDFNEWVRKCASTDMRMSYVFTHEYEIWEWNLGGTFNYAEMAALICPRPFMVERGHDDGVGLDEWVNYEYAKVQRLYNKLGLAQHAVIEHFDGPHTIHGVGTFEFLDKHLRPSEQAKR